ncbi:MAG: HAMP domain-containing methyl-accepting chemotaxis protein [Pseudobdellovibrio sp.]
MFKKTSLKQKLSLMFGFSAIILLVVGILSVRSLTIVSEYYAHVSKVNLPNSVVLQKMDTEARGILYNLVQLNLNGNDAAEVERLVKKIETQKAEYAKLDKAYVDLDFEPGEKEIYDVVAKTWNELSKDIDKSLPLAKSAAASPADRVAFGNYYRGDFNTTRQNYYKAIADLLKYQSDEAAKWGKLAEDTGAHEKILSLSVVCVGFVLIILCGFFFTRMLSNTLTSVSESLAKGAVEVNNAATEIASSSESLSSSTTELASSVQETSASVEELTAMVAKNADNSEKSKDKANSSQAVAQRGKQSVGEMIVAIQEINESNTLIMQAVEESNNNISEITKVIADIGSKTKVINDIVFQTKLLSFNASVEAARAGEHGKGFSVVAEEVGNLAQMSGNAAQEISTMLDVSIKKVEEIVSQTKQKVEVLVRTGKEKVQKGQMTAQQCEESLNQIVEEVEQVSHMVSEISVASKEQSTGIQEITKAVSQMDVVTQQNAGSSQTAAATSVQLADQSTELNAVVNELKKLIYGDTGAGDSYQPPARQTERKKSEGPAKAATRTPARETHSKVIPLQPKSTASSFESKKLTKHKLTANGQAFPKGNDPRFEEF